MEMNVQRGRMSEEVQAKQQFQSIEDDEHYVPTELRTGWDDFAPEAPTESAQGTHYGGAEDDEEDLTSGTATLLFPCLLEIS